jgi:hypothetical protein
VRPGRAAGDCELLMVLTSQNGRAREIGQRRKARERSDRAWESATHSKLNSTREKGRRSHIKGRAVREARSDPRWRATELTFSCEWNGGLKKIRLADGEAVGGVFLPANS